MKLQHLVPKVALMRAEGQTLQQIGHELQLSKQRISQICKSAQRLEQIQAEWGWPFSVRTFNCLQRMAVRTKEEALSLYRSGHIHPNVVSGFGWVSYKEICDWLGVPMTKKPTNQSTVCPHCGKQI